MRSILIISLLSISLGFSQTQLYQEAYKKAMRDSVVTADEQALLDLINVESDTSITTQNSDMTSGSVAYQALNQEGRWRMIYYNMVMGNSLYGFGLPYLFKSDDLLTYMGFQLVAAAGGFYVSYNYSKNIDISLGRGSFIETGSTISMASLIPIHAAVGPGNWNDFDPHLRGALSYLMVAAPVGMIQGNKLFNRWQPTDGQAAVIRYGTALGAINGLATYFFLNGDRDNNSETSVNNSYRALAGLGYGGTLAGLHYSHEYFGRKPYTTGDALMIREASSLGVYIAGRLLSTAELQSVRLNVLVGMALLDGFSIWGDHLVEGVDFTEGDAVIVAMGTLAANGVWRGLSLLAGGDINSTVSGSMDIATSFVGFYTTYQSVKARRLELGYPDRREQKINFKSRPTILGNFHEPVPGMSFEINF